MYDRAALKRSGRWEVKLQTKEIRAALVVYNINEAISLLPPINSFSLCLTYSFCRSLRLVKDNQPDG